MASESTAHSAFSLMGYWLRDHSGSRNNCLISLGCLQYDFINLARAVVFAVLRFGNQAMLLAINFDGRSFSEKIKAIWTASFNESENRDIGTFSVSHFADEFATLVGSSFQSSVFYRLKSCYLLRNWPWNSRYMEEDLQLSSHFPPLMDLTFSSVCLIFFLIRRLK